MKNNPFPRSIRLSVDLEAQLQEAADRNNRTLSEEMRSRLEASLDAEANEATLRRVLDEYRGGTLDPFIPPPPTQLKIVG